MIFNISRGLATPTLRGPTDATFDLMQVDRGYQVSVPRDIAVGRPPGEEERLEATTIDSNERTQDEPPAEKEQAEEELYVTVPRDIAVGRPPGEEEQLEATTIDSDGRTQDEPLVEKK